MSRTYRTRARNNNNLGIKASSLYFLNDISNLNSYSTNQSTDNLALSSNWKDLYTLNPELLGRGHFSKVYKAKRGTSGNNVAIKVIRRRRRGADKLDEIMREVEMMQSLSKSNVGGFLQLIDYHTSTIDVALVMEFAMGGTIYNVVHDSRTGLPEVYCKIIIAKIMTALNYIHSQEIVHLDIKADNILLRHPYPSTEAVICDFGVAKKLSKSQIHRELVGTPDYIAPEVSNYEEITCKSDMWSMGVLSFFLLTNVSPFLGFTKEETMANVTTAQFKFTGHLINDNLQVARDFISKLLIRGPEKRLSASDSLSHEFLSSVPILEISSTASTFTHNESHLAPIEPINISSSPVNSEISHTPIDEGLSTMQQPSPFKPRIRTSVDHNIRDMVVSQYNPDSKSFNKHLQCSMIDLLKTDNDSTEDLLDIKQKTQEDNSNSSITDCYKEISEVECLIENLKYNKNKVSIEYEPVEINEKEKMDILEIIKDKVEEEEEKEQQQQQDEEQQQHQEEEHSILQEIVKRPTGFDEPFSNKESIEISSLTPFTTNATTTSTTSNPQNSFTDYGMDNSQIFSADTTTDELNHNTETVDESSSFHDMNNTFSSYDIKNNINFDHNTTSSISSKENQRPESMIDISGINDDTNDEDIINDKTINIRNMKETQHQFRSNCNIPNMYDSRRRSKHKIQCLISKPQINDSFKNRQSLEIINQPTPDNINRTVRKFTNDDTNSSNITTKTAPQLVKRRSISKSLRKDSDKPRPVSTSSSAYSSNNIYPPTLPKKHLPNVKKNKTLVENNNIYNHNNNTNNINIISTKNNTPSKLNVKDEFKSQPNLSSVKKNDNSTKSTPHLPDSTTNSNKHKIFNIFKSKKDPNNMNHATPTESTKPTDKTKSSQCIIS